MPPHNHSDSPPVPGRNLQHMQVPIWLLGLVVLAVILAIRPVRAASTTLVITEVLYDPTTAEPDNEWFELVNLSDTTIDLSSYKIGDEETAGSGEGMVQFPSGASIAAGQVVVVANSATAFQSANGTAPDYEMSASDGNVPDMTRYTTWAGGTVQLANSGDELLLLDGSDALVDAVSWGSSNWAFNPDVSTVTAGHSIERNPADSDTDSAGDWIDQAAPNPGSVTLSGPTPTDTPALTPTSGPSPTPTNTPDPSCGKSSTYTAVWEIQGNGHTSPLNGQSLSEVQGIVTADFQSGTGGPQEPRGFFVQAHETDCDAATSDGIFVYTGSSAKAITVGDLVSISGGSVTEYQGPASFTWDLTVTELSCTAGCNVSRLQANYGLPTPLEYDPPADNTLALDYNEAREGMLAQVSVDATTISAANQFNEFIVRRGTGQDRLHRDDLAYGERIMVDGDGVAAANCGTNGFGDIHTFDTITYNPAGGSAIYGPLNYNFNMYKVQQDDDSYCISFTAGDHSSYDPALNPAPAADANILTVAGMNAWNFFDTRDDPEKGDPVATQAEYDANSLKRADAICNAAGLNQPLILGLQEVENDVVLQKLADDVAAMCGVTYNVYTLAGPDNRSIEVAFLTRADRVTVVAVNDRQGCSATNWGIDYENSDHPPDVSCTGSTPYYLFNRPPLELQAEVTLAGTTRTIYVLNNHFKSKLSSSSCSTSDCTDRRVEQAQHVDNLVDGILANDPNAYVMVMGDLNDYYNSDPLDVLDKTSGVLTNTWQDLSGPPSSGQGTIARYSYIHDGVSQTLDHLLVSDALNAVARTVAPRHVNADWPASRLNDSTMYRSSDHDYLLIGFDFSGDSPTPTPTSTPSDPTPTPTPTSTPSDPTPTPTPTSTPSEPTATPTPTATPDASAMHVGDLDGVGINNGSTWTAEVTILVVDAAGNPVSAATVTGSWSQGASGTVNCLTGSDGRCTVSEPGIRKNTGSVVFTVTGVTHSSLSYDAAANSDPDGDSDGTTITVNKP